MLLIALACVTETPGETGVVAEPLPEVWGPAPASDLDPADDIVEVHLVAQKASVELLDGTRTTLWTYNGQFPGPMIQARVGDTLRVVFENQLDEETTIHWHGLRIDDAMDGVPAIQDPVQPGETFTYEFVLPDSGSFWYHPHVRGHEQVERGLQGPLVVHEAEVVDVPERFFVLDDASLQEDGNWNPFNVHTSHGLQMAGRYGNVLLVNGDTEVLEDTVQPVERWRILNSANARTLYIDLGDAEWRVIGVDGTLLEEPFSVDRYELPVGRRVDIEVLPGEAPELYVSIPDTSTVPVEWTDYPVFLGTREGDMGRWSDWNAETLPEMKPIEQELEITLNVAGGGTSIDWMINDAVYGDHDTIPVRANTPTRITITDETRIAHPFHLHGQFFQVVDRNGELKKVDAGRMDTVHVYGEDELVLYSEFDNPGLWMAHCHILEHAERGMMTELLVE